MECVIRGTDPSWLADEVFLLNWRFRCWALSQSGSMSYIVIFRQSCSDSTHSRAKLSHHRDEQRKNLSYLQTLMHLHKVSNRYIARESRSSGAYLLRGACVDYTGEQLWPLIYSVTRNESAEAVSDHSGASVLMVFQSLVRWQVT